MLTRTIKNFLSRQQSTNQLSKQLPEGLRNLIEGEGDKDPLSRKQFDLTSLNDLQSGAEANLIDELSGVHAGNKLRQVARRRRLIGWTTFMDTIDDSKQDEVAAILITFQEQETKRIANLTSAMEAWRYDLASKDPNEIKKKLPWYKSMVQSYFESADPKEKATKILAKQLKHESILIKKLQKLGIDINSDLLTLLKGTTSAMELVDVVNVKKDQDQKQDQDNVTSGTRIFVLDFKGDQTPTQVEPLKKEITAILTLPISKRPSEVVLRLFSGGGSAYGYGLAATELKRLTNNNIKLTICVDEVAASGGYMMACIADTIVASPWSILGSVGVISGMPNAADRLEREGLKFYKTTAGVHKNNIDPFTKPTEEGLKQTQIDLERVLTLFSKHVDDARGVNGSNKLTKPIKDIATGDTWQGIDALEVGLVDELMTSEELISQRIASGNDLWLLKKRSKRKQRSVLEKILGGKNSSALLSMLQNSNGSDSILNELTSQVGNSWDKTQLEMNSTLPQLK